MPKVSPDETEAGSAWYALLIMSLAYACHSIDRQVVSVVLEPIKHEFDVSDWAMGLLGGLAYTIPFALACIPLGYLIDRTNRTRLLAAILALWSGFTILCGFAAGFVTLLLARMTVGAAEAGAQPTIMSLTSDYFAPQKRSTAIGYFYISTAVGVAASFMLGGFVAANWGWRAAFFVAGLPGILIALAIIVSVKEPARGQFDEKKVAALGLGEALQHSLKTPALLHLAVAMVLTALCLSAMWFWATSLMVRSFGLGLGQAGLYVGIAASCSALGSAYAGRLGDRISRENASRLSLVPAVMVGLCAPLGIAFAWAPSFPLALTFLILTSIMFGGFFGPSYAMMIALTPPSMRGMAFAAIQMIVNLVGTGLGPLVTGTLSDVFGGANSLRPALALTFLVALWAALHYLLASRAAGRPNVFPSNKQEMS